jgi:ATP-dependent Clp protease ATP-binding subunit ClpA
MLGHKHIGTEDLFVGLRREEKSFAAELLREAGVRLEEARKQLAASSGEPAPSLGVAGGREPSCAYGRVRGRWSATNSNDARSPVTSTNR